MHDINLQYTKENLFWHDVVWDPQRLKKMILRMRMKNNRVNNLSELISLVFNDNIKWSIAIVCWAYILRQQLPHYSWIENDSKWQNMHWYDF